MKVLLSIAAVLAGATTLAATAHADPNDEQFLQNIRDNMGREITDPQALIASAHDICSELQQGKSPVEACPPGPNPGHRTFRFPVMNTI